MVWAPFPDNDPDSPLLAEERALLVSSYAALLAAVRR